MKRLGAGLILAATLVLAGCSYPTENTATPTAAAQAAFLPEGPPTVTLLTMISNRSGAGGHSALMIDGSQRVMFDPAGSWYHPDVPEIGDALYGLSPAYLDFYMDYHARETYHVVVQEVVVPPAVAEQLIATVRSHGAVSRAQCSASISRILSQTPGFSAVGSTWFPAAMMRQFENVPGVQTRRVYDDDSDDNIELLQAQLRQERRAQQAEAAN